MKKTLVLIGLCYGALFPVCAQQANFVLHCPLRDAQVKDPPPSRYSYTQPDRRVILLSPTDTLLRAGVSGTIISVERNQERTYDIVMYHGDYYFWMVGIHEPRVRRNEAVNAGQVLGSLVPGSEIEFMMFLDETPVDPKPFLRCR